MQTVTPDITGQKQGNNWFRPGQSGNIAGRPKGARSRLQENFLVVLAEDFKENGEAAIVKMRQERPSEYVKCIASLMPRQLELDRPLQEMTDDELYAGIAALQRLVDAENARQGSADATITESPVLLQAIH
jgi:hypothetical protein